MTMQEKIQQAALIHAREHGGNIDVAVYHFGHGAQFAANEMAAAPDLLAENERLRKSQYTLICALRNLYDEQNGAPLEIRRDNWEAAMNNAKVALNLYEK